MLRFLPSELPVLNCSSIIFFSPLPKLKCWIKLFACRRFWLIACYYYYYSYYYCCCRSYRSVVKSTNTKHTHKLNMLCSVSVWSTMEHSPRSPSHSSAPSAHPLSLAFVVGLLSLPHQCLCMGRTAPHLLLSRSGMAPVVVCGWERGNGGEESGVDREEPGERASQAGKRAHWGRGR